MTTHTENDMVLHFDAPEWMDKGLLKYLAAFLSGTVGQKVLAGLFGRWKKGDSNAKELIVRMVDESGQMRHEMAQQLAASDARERELLKELAAAVENRHASEMKCALLEGKNGELERQRAGLEHQLAGVLAMREVAQPAPAPARQGE